MVMRKQPLLLKYSTALGISNLVFLIPFEALTFIHLDAINLQEP